MNAWRTALVCALAVLAPTLMTYTTGDVVAGGATGHEIMHSIAGTIGGAAAGAVIGHELNK